MANVIVSAGALRGRQHAVRLLDCRSGPGARERYLERHLAGALHVDLEGDLSARTAHPEHGGRHPLPAPEVFAATLGRLGIDPSTPVVLYDDKAGANAAARAWWMLRAAGHRDVRVLDGGIRACESTREDRGVCERGARAGGRSPPNEIDAAERAGLAFESGEPRVEAKPPYPVAREWSLPTADIDAVARVARDPAWRVIDVRAAERYRGEVEPIDPIAGHIPGALNLPLTESLDREGCFESKEALAAHFRSRLGLSSEEVPMERVIVSCGSGVTACHTLLALEHAGLSGAALYVGSWSEWCRSARERAP